MKSKPLLVGLLMTAALFHPLNATAQNPASVGRDQAAPHAPRERLDIIADALQLTRDQKEKAGPILRPFYADRDAVFGNAKLTREEKAAKARQLRLETAEKLQPILTPPQLDKWKAMLDAIPAIPGQQKSGN